MRRTAWLLTAIVVLRALVPLGFMPDRVAAGEGRIEFILCHGGEGQAAQPTAGAGGEPATPDRVAACDFALLAQAWLPLGPVAVVAPPNAPALLVRQDGAAEERQYVLMGGGGARAPPRVS